jgi:hypothetical protein
VALLAYYANNYESTSANRQHRETETETVSTRHRSLSSARLQRCRQNGYQHHQHQQCCIGGADKSDSNDDHAYHYDSNGNDNVNVLAQHESSVQCYDDDDNNNRISYAQQRSDMTSGTLKNHKYAGTAINDNDNDHYSNDDHANDDSTNDLTPAISDASRHSNRSPSSVTTSNTPSSTPASASPSPSKTRTRKRRSHTDTLTARTSTSLSYDDYRRLTKSLIRSIQREKSHGNVLDSLMDLQSILNQCTASENYACRSVVVNSIVDSHGLDTLQLLSSDSDRDRDRDSSDANHDPTPNLKLKHAQSNGRNSNDTLKVEVKKCAEHLLQTVVPLIWND